MPITFLFLDENRKRKTIGMNINIFKTCLELLNLDSTDLNIYYGTSYYGIHSEKFHDML